MLDSAKAIHLPFNFNVIKSDSTLIVEIINADEKIVCDEIEIKNDTVTIKLPVFDTEIIAKIEDGKLSGNWINHYRKDKNVIPFHAEFGNSKRFDAAENKRKDFNISDKWETIFSPNSEDSSNAILEFRKYDEATGTVWATFLTETGDYRFLEGTLSNNKLLLSCFDGSHAFLFDGNFDEKNNLKGLFYSGSHWQEPWIANIDNDFKLREADSLTYMNNGFDKFDFSFPNSEGKNISLSDERYKDKVVIVQIMGTWCPNCMDETKFLSAYYEENKSKGIEVIALAFEKTNEFEKAKQNIERLKKRLNVNYEVLIAGTNNKEEASKKLPMLNKIMSYPTTIIIDKKGAVRKISTGFSGPGTGEHYEKFVKEFTAFNETLLKN